MISFSKKCRFTVKETFKKKLVLLVSALNSNLRLMIGSRVELSLLPLTSISLVKSVVIIYSILWRYECYVYRIN